jgi:hypothetical protein
MELAQLILEYVKVLIWPIVGLIFFLLFRRQMYQLVSRISSSAQELDISVGNNSLKIKIVEKAIHDAITASTEKTLQTESNEKIQEIINTETKKISKIINLSPLAIDILLILGTELDDRSDEWSIQELIRRRYFLEKRPTYAVSNALLELEKAQLISQAGVFSGFYPPPLKYKLTEDGKNVVNEIKKVIGDN